jgi:hypothetical protein
VQIGLRGVSQIAAGDFDAAAVMSNGSVLTWGGNSEGQLGIGTTDSSHFSPVLVSTLAGGSLAAAGQDDVMVVASPAPRIPSVIDDTQAGAAQALQAAGYVLGRVSTVVDITCQYVGVVKTQSPAAGTVAQPGTSVSVSTRRRAANVSASRRRRNGVRPAHSVSRGYPEERTTYVPNQACPGVPSTAALITA